MPEGKLEGNDDGGEEDEKRAGGIKAAACPFLLCCAQGIKQLRLFVIRFANFPILRWLHGRDNKPHPNEPKWEKDWQKPCQDARPRV